MMRRVADVGDVRGIRVLVRASLNVPIVRGSVRSDFRLRQSIKTIEWFRSKGARVIVCGHLSGEKTASMFPIYEALKKSLPIVFVDDVAGERAKQEIANLREGTVLLLENLRRMQGEEGNNLEFATALKNLADIYVMDDFSVMHRKHASVVLVPAMMHTYAGLVVMQEVEQLQKALLPKNPSLAIMAGAKFHTKEGLIRKCLPLYDRVFVGGALSNDFLKAKGYEVGRSLVSHAQSAIQDLINHEKIILPVDVTVDGPLGRIVKEPTNILSSETILDAGPRTLEMMAPYIARAKTILWNGPLGNYENGFIEQTEKLASLVSASSAMTVIGGGDSVAAIDSIEIDTKRVFISTGGGAMIEFLTNGTLPGLEALGFVPPILPERSLSQA